MRITIVRHGETDFNKQKKIQGRIDNPLNDLGLEQGKRAGKYLKEKGYNFDFIFASPLIRAIETAEEIKEILGFEGSIIELEEFIERDFGEFDGLPIEGNINIVNDDEPGKYEHHKELEERVMKGLNRILDLGGENALIVCHSHAIKAVVKQLRENFNYYSFLANTAINNIDYIDGKFVATDVNIDEHLKD